MRDYLYLSYDASMRGEYDLPRLKEISIQISDPKLINPLKELHLKMAKSQVQV